jgi:hypothetical protein
MTQLLNKKALALVFPFALGSTSFAQQVVTTTVGSPAKFEIESKVVSAETKECSIIVMQPNGSTEVVMLQAPHFKTSLSFTPTMQGTSVISWKGESTLNGKVENVVVGGVKQIFSNIGELVTLRNMTQVVLACPGSGTITIVATPKVQPVVAQIVAPATVTPVAPPPPQASSRFRSTANIPTVMNPPIEISAFRAKYNNDDTYRAMVDDFNVNRSKQSLTALRLYSELGDANAQFLYGLAHLEDWTGLYNAKRACYWIRQSAVQGLSQARLVLANKAVYDKDCFDVPPTLDEAKTWAQLASMSSERAVKENADKLLQDILRIQITNQR